MFPCSSSAPKFVRWPISDGTPPVYWLNCIRLRNWHEQRFRLVFEPTVSATLCNNQSASEWCLQIGCSSCKAPPDWAERCRWAVCRSSCCCEPSCAYIAMNGLDCGSKQQIADLTALSVSRAEPTGWGLCQRFRCCPTTRSTSVPSASQFSGNCAIQLVRVRISFAGPFRQGSRGPGSLTDTLDWSNDPIRTGSCRGDSS